MVVKGMSFQLPMSAPETEAPDFLGESLKEVGGFGSSGSSAPAADDGGLPGDADSLFAELNEDASEVAADADELELDPELTNVDIEEIEVTNARGEKVKLKIDYKDREGIKRAHQKAAGIDKLYTRYTDLRTENSAMKEQAATAAKELEVLRSIETLHGDGTPAELEALFEHLGAEHTYAVAKSIVDKQDRVRNMTPEQRAAWENDQALQARIAKGEAAQAELAKVNERISAVEAQGIIERAQSAVDSVFPEFSFVGKIADTKAAQELDDFMFRGLQSRLAEVKQQGFAVTPELVRTLLKTFASSIPAAIHKEAHEHAKRSHTATSTAAKRAVQNAALKSSGAGSKGNAGRKIDWGNQADMSDLLMRELNR